MARGGFRPGAGRKKGSLTEVGERRREIIEKATLGGITPLEVMLEAMREIYYGPNGKQKNALAAFNLAREAAPYMHPKLAAIEAKTEIDVTQRVISAEPLTEDEWATKYGNSLEPAAGAAESTH